MADYLQVRDYLQILVRHRWLIALIMAAGVGTAALVIWKTTPVYLAEATLQADVDMNVLGVDRPLLPIDQRDWMREFLPTQLGILQSHEIASAAHDALAKAQPAATVPAVADIALGRSAYVVKDTRLVRVGFQSTDPTTAANVANALAAAYVEQNMAFRSKASTDASQWLARQVEEQRKLVSQSEAALQRYRMQHGADELYADSQGVEHANIAVQKLASLQEEVTKARTETIEKEALYRQLSTIQANHEPLDTLPAIASNGYIQTLKANLTTLQSQMQQTSKELGARHPDYIKLRAAVDNAERELRTEETNQAAAIRHDFEAAQARERSLTGALNQQKSAVQALNGKTVEYTALEREAATNRDVLDNLLQRSREATLAGQLKSTNVRIVERAQTPDEPILPRTLRTLAIGFVGSGGLALVLVVILEVFNTRVTTPDDVKRYLRIQVLGVVPEALPTGGRQTPLLGSGAPVQFAELLQGVRTNLMMSRQLEPDPTLLVTSAEPGEGKSVSAANIAISLAGLKQRVLLIDADLRKPRLHELFGETRTPGLADVLMSRTNKSEFRKTKVAGLWLLPAGSECHNPANLLGSEYFTRLIDHLKQHFDAIVIDSPPVLAVTDSCVMARAASGVLLVVDCHRTSRDVAAAAVERLDAVGATIVGAMLNRAELNRRDTSYLPYYHRAYESYYSQLDGDSFELPDVTSTALQKRG